MKTRPPTPGEGLTSAVEPWRLRHAAWIGALVGALGAVGDFWGFSLLDVTMEAGGRDVFYLVAGFFVVSYIVLGNVIGSLARTRARLRASHAVIEAQVAALEVKQRALIQAEKLAAIGRMAAGVAHEVRNPLGVIRSSASLVAEGLDPDSGDHEALEFVVEEVDRLNVFVTELLDFVRPVQPELGRVRVDVALNRAHRLATVELDKRGVSFGGEVIEADALADEDLLTRALAGLFINAAQAASGGRVEASVTRAAGRVRVDVRDDGPGVPSELRAQIFEPFFTTRPEGTGLGLAMAAKLVESVGGELALVDGEGLGPGGRGACFRLTLRGGGWLQEAA